jgi:hypothetical protein
MYIKMPLIINISGIINIYNNIKYCYFFLL